MPRVPYSFVSFPVLLLFLSIGCGKSPEPAGEQSAAPVQRVALTAEHMQGHFSKVRELQEAIIRGDVEGARAPAQWLADHPEVSGTAGTERPLKDMKAAAQAVASAQDVQAGAAAAATMVGTCGSCHTAANVEPKLPPIVATQGDDERSRQMRAHQGAVDQLYRGLIVPASGEWRTGAEALKAAPLNAKAFKDVPGKEISADIAAAEQQLKALADRAINAPDKATRVQVYGGIIATCANCHGLHGRVWGPGLPKTN